MNRKAAKVSRVRHEGKCACIQCTNCGAMEVEDCRKPVEEWHFQIRANRVGDEHGKWWSECRVCGKWF